MRALARFSGRLLAILVVAAAGFWWFGPYERVDLRARFDPARFGAGVQAYFDSAEAAFAGMTPGTARRVVWQPGFQERRTPVAVLYIHGFSASSEEIRPVPDLVAAALGANLVFTRLAGHGLGGDALAGPVANDWMRDVAEGLAAARQVGERVVVIATSTGGTLATAAAADPEMSANVAAMVLVSPNYGINDPRAWLLGLPAARYWLPPIVGRDLGFTPGSPAHGTYWTTSYPSVALLPMAALVQAVAALDMSAIAIPAMFRICDADAVVRADLTRAVAAGWGGPAVLGVVEPGPGIDPDCHVIAGDIRSPAMTDETVRDILDWLRQVGIG